MSKHIFIISLLLILCGTAFAQSPHTVNGMVTDATTKEALVGVTVYQIGSSNGTMTDANGRFRLKAKEGDKIKIAYVGYVPQEIKIAGTKDLIVSLTSNSQLDEVVVVGYEAMKKRDVLGAVSKVNSKELVAVPSPGVSEALEGRIAGVQVTSTTGAPGAGVSVRVRGTGSINSSNDPLYVIDGIPSTNGLNFVSPNDIASVTVLKDASSAAIYGSRANNGVVLITTKKGQKGKVKVSYSGQTGVQIHGDLPRMVNGQQYVDMYNAAARNDGRQLIDDKFNKGFANENYLSDIFRTALLNVHNLSVSGGTDKIDYLVSGSYYGQDGIIKNSDYQKLSGRANLQYKISHAVKLGFDLNGGKDQTHSVPSSGDGYGSNEGGSVVRYAFMRPAAVPERDAQGNFVDYPSEYFGNPIYNSFFGDSYNPLGVIANSLRKKSEDTFLGKINLDVTLPCNLAWNTNFGVDYLKNSYDINDTTWGSNNRINNPRSLVNQSHKSLGWTLNSVLNGHYTFNDDHHFSFLAGTEAIHYSGFDSNASTSVNGHTNYRSDWAYSLLSFFAKADYNYKEKYYVSALAREDGSSRFTAGNQWGTFYSVSAGWDISKENFMKDATIISLLKLRAGYGTVGNQDVALYAYTDKYMPYSNYPFGGNPSIGYKETQFGNKNLKWETSNQVNVGLDMNFHKDDFGFSLDYYNKTTNNMLVKASLPPSAGYAAPYFVNAGSILNEGVDIELFARKQYHDGGFSATLNWGFLHNKVLKLDAPIQAGRIDNGIYAKYIEQGYSVGSFYLYQMDGVFQNNEEIMKSAYQGANTRPGDVKYKDVNHDGVIDEKDRVHCGSSIPTQTMGLNLTGNYKNWDIQVFFQGAFGQKIYNQIGQETDGFYRASGVTLDTYQHYWRGEGTSNDCPLPSWNDKANNVMPSTRFLQDGSYVRLKNVQLGYTFALKSKLVSNLRLYVDASNLLTFTKYKGMDPEMTASANAQSEGDLGNGIDWGTYPVARSFTFGLNVTF